jgi:2-hydroxychromene-2-carboxylate isomerase
MISDCDLIAKKDKSSFIWNSKFPINSLNIMRGYIFISDEYKDLYLNVIFDAYWKDDLDTSNKEILETLLEKCKINLNEFFDGIKDPKIKDKLKNKTQEAHDKEIFGAPSFVVNNKIFWGQDRLEFVLDEYNK